MGVLRNNHFKEYDSLDDHAILGVDPGKISGIALWVPSKNHKKIHSSAELPRHEIRDWVMEHMLHLPHVSLCLIATENFAQARGGRPLTNQPDALRVIGLLRVLADELECSFTTNGAGPAKKLANNDRLRRIGWYRYTRDEHDIDARRQVLSTMARFHKELFRDLIKEEEDDAAR